MREKLIRDRVPELFDMPGSQVRVAADEELGRFLAAKLIEEAEEYRAASIVSDPASLDASAIEELADVLEVVRAIADFRGLDVTGLERVRSEKANLRGRFSRRLIWSIPETVEAPWVSPAADEDGADTGTPRS